MSGDAHSDAEFRLALNRVYRWYAAGFIAFVLVLALLEQQGLSRQGIGLIFLLATIGLYAGIGIMSRTTDASEYYVAGRRVPAVYNGMATGADWMSAASFISLAGTLYLTGFNGLAFIMGWTGGYCLVAFLLAPYLRRFGQFTIPDFLGERYGGNLPRMLGVLTGVAFELGIFLGLGGILLCSFLGGMRAVTWTQVTQYLVITVAYLLPVVWLSVKQTGIPVPQAIYGYQLQKVSAREDELIQDPKEQQVQQIFSQRSAELAAKLQDPAAALTADRARANREVAALKASDAPVFDIYAADRALSNLPRNLESARAFWTQAKAEADAKSRPLNGMPPHAQQFAGDPAGDEHARHEFEISRRNFLALVFCLMVGTAALPHILIRYYTVPSVKEVRQSVTWSLLFIVLVYITAPALAVLVKYEVFTLVVGTPFSQLPDWITAWNKVDPSLLSAVDVNRDGILQLNELSIGGDIIMLAAPAIGGLPYVVSGLVAAGGLAAALSTADGLLLTISSALSHDVYYKMIDPNASTARRVTLSKVLLLVVALGAAYVASRKPADILFLVSAAFSFAAAAFFPALTLGIFWKRATGVAASLGIVAGLGTTLVYMVLTQPWMRSLFGVTRPIELWWGIQPISAGVFGVPVGFAVILVVSLLTRRPGTQVMDLVNHVRYPGAMPRSPEKRQLGAPWAGGL